MWQIACIVNRGVDDIMAVTFNLHANTPNPEYQVCVAMKQLGIKPEDYKLEIQVTPEDCERTG